MTELLRNRPFPLTAGGILIGIALMATRSLPVAVIGAALIVAGLLVPFAQLRCQSRSEKQPNIDNTTDSGDLENRRTVASAPLSRRKHPRRVPLSAHEELDPEQPAFP